MTITVITGSMFSGKTEELIKRIKIEKIRERKYGVFTHIINNRDTDYLKSRNGEEVKVVKISNSTQLYNCCCGETKYDIVFIDEIQFFDKDIVNEIKYIHNLKNIDFIISGLDMDYKTNVFETTAFCMSIADQVIKLKAVCSQCKSHNGIYSKLITTNTTTSNIVIEDEKNRFEPNCKLCFNEYLKKLK
jgi:thymidine kinase